MQEARSSHSTVKMLSWATENTSPTRLLRKQSAVARLEAPSSRCITSSIGDPTRDTRLLMDSRQQPPAVAPTKLKSIFAISPLTNHNNVTAPRQSSSATARSFTTKTTKKNINAQQDCPLFKLPPELRLEIYGYLFGYQLLDGNERKQCCPIPPLLQTCRLISDDGFEAYEKSIADTLAVLKKRRRFAYAFYWPRFCKFTSRQWQTFAPFVSRRTISETSAALRELFLINHAMLRLESDSGKVLKN